MTLATVLTGVETYGDWFKFKTAQGFDVSTKYGEVANDAQRLIGQPVVIEYAEKPGKLNEKTGQPFTNRYLNAIAADRSIPVEMSLDDVFNQTLTAHPPFNSLEAPKVSAPAPIDDRGAIMGRNNIAAAAVDTLLSLTDGSAANIQRVLDGLALWSETGKSVFTPDESDVPF